MKVLFLAMDRGHLRVLRQMAPAHLHPKIRTFLALDTIEEACRGLLAEIRTLTSG